MKYALTVALVLTLSWSGARAAEPPPASSARIQGQIQHPVGKVVTVQIEGQKPVEAPVDAAGRFKLTVPVKAAGAASLETGEEYTNLWLTPGDDLTLSLDAQRFDETLKYTGTGARVNNYLAAEMLGQEAMDERGQVARGRGPAGFSAFCDSVQAVQEKQLTAALGAKPTAAETAFLTWKRRERAYEWAAQRLYYASQMKVPATDAFYAFMSANNLPLDNPGALESAAYQSYVPGALGYYVQLDGTTPATTPKELATLRMAERRLSAPVREAILPQMVVEGVTFGPLAAADSVQRYALTHLILKSQARTQIEKTWAARQLTRPGLLAPDLHAVDEAGKPFDWASVRGKVVYLDFWASWCGPCIGEMPAAQKLHVALHDRSSEVVFLNVSVDGSGANWRKGMVKHKVDGQNLHSAGDWQSPALKAYGISSIPRYLVIGPDGVILDGNAPRPSDGAEDAIRAALAKGK